MPQDEEDVLYLKAALAVCNKIFDEHKVHLLYAVRIERELLKIEVKTAEGADELKSVRERLESE